MPVCKAPPLCLAETLSQYKLGSLSSISTLQVAVRAGTDTIIVELLLLSLPLTSSGTSAWLTSNISVASVVRVSGLKLQGLSSALELGSR